MVNEPAGTTTISGQLTHSLKLSFGLRVRSSSGVSGCTPFSGKNCRGSGAGGDCACSIMGPGLGFGRSWRGFADALPAETASAAIVSAARIFDLAGIADPSGGRLYVGWSSADRRMDCSGLAQGFTFSD